MNFLRSNSWESSNVGRSPGLAGRGESRKYGCCSASMALIRFFQSSLSNSLRSEMAPEPYLQLISTKISMMCRPMTYCRKRCDKVDACGGKFKPSAPGNDLHPGIVSSVGVPTRSKMILSWFASLSPERMGLPMSISPKTQLAAISKKKQRKGGKNLPNAPQIDSSCVLSQLQ